MTRPSSLTRHASPWLVRIGLALALVMGVFQIINAARAGFQPVTFADYMGLPVSGADTGFVQVYGLRSLFIGGVVLWLVLTSRLTVLAVMASLAIVLPLGDAWLTYQAGAPTGTVIRHLVIAAYLLVCASLMFAASRQAGAIS